MTDDELRKKHPTFGGSELHQDLIRWAEAKHPIRNMPRGNDQLGILMNGAVALLNHHGGYEELLGNIRSLAHPPEKPAVEPPDTWSDPEIPLPPKP